MFYLTHAEIYDKLAKALDAQASKGFKSLNHTQKSHFYGEDSPLIWEGVGAILNRNKRKVGGSVTLSKLIAVALFLIVFTTNVFVQIHDAWYFLLFSLTLMLFNKKLPVESITNAVHKVVAKSPTKS